MAECGVPPEGATGERRRSPENGGEAGGYRAPGQCPQNAEQENDVQQVGQQDGPLEAPGVQAKEVVRPQEHHIARQEGLATERLQQEGQRALVHDVEEVHEVVGVEERPRDGMVHPGARREGEQQQEMPR